MNRKSKIFLRLFPTFPFDPLHTYIQNLHDDRFERILNVYIESNLLGNRLKIKTL